MSEINEIDEIPENKNNKKFNLKKLQNIIDQLSLSNKLGLFN